jgi:hypothetical protein
MLKSLCTAALLGSSLASEINEDDLKAAIQTALDKWSKPTGWGFTFGYVDKDMKFGLASGPKSY